MAENPLLPNRKLKDLYLLISRARALRRRQPGSGAIEAIIAAAHLHLEDGDFLSPLPGNKAAETLAAERGTSPSSPQRLPTAAGVSVGLKLGQKERLAMAFAASGTAAARANSGWQSALSFAAQSVAPLLLVCIATDKPEPRAAADTLTWPNMLKAAKPLHVPVLSVDGTDAVALFRVLQESAIRARSGGGPAVLWCVLPSVSTPADDALRKLRSWMSTRNIPVPSAAKKK